MKTLYFSLRVLFDDDIMYSSLMYMFKENDYNTKLNLKENIKHKNYSS